MLRGPWEARPRRVPGRLVAVAWTALAVACSGGGVEPDGTAVDTVVVVPDRATIAVGASFTLHAEVRDVDGTVLPGRQPHWAAEDPAVALVTQEGRVTARQPGFVRIAASVEGKAGFALVSVSNTPLFSVTVTPPSATLLAGNTMQFTAVARDSAGGVLPGRPIAWRSTNASVASVSQTGLVSALGSGATVVSAESEGRTGFATVTVSTVPVASVIVSPSTQSLAIGGTAQLSARTVDAQGNTLTGRVVTWTSSAPTVASVSSTGLVSALAAGSATIRATSEGKTGTSAITVVDSGAASVTVTPSSATLDLGDQVQLAAEARDGTGQVIAKPRVTWSSSDAFVASVNANGRVTAWFPGTATITATSGSAKGTALIIVRVGG